MRNKYILIGVVVGVLLSSVVVVLAGNLDSPGAPTDAASESYTLKDIYDRLDAGTDGSKSTFTEPASGPSSTMHTLNDIMAKAPEMDDTNGAGVADVASGKKFWGLTSGAWGLQTGTASGGGGAGVPKTGQTTSYATGDDGDLQKGVAWPTPRFTDNADGTVTDNLTGLIWLKNANCAGATRDWSTALSDVAQLNTDGTMNSNNCGDTSNVGSHQNDWRLPNVRELYSLIHSGQPDPGAWLNSQGFSSVVSDFYWSSTTFAFYTGWAWAVDLGYSTVFDQGKTGDYSVWPVRGGQ